VGDSNTWRNEPGDSEFASIASDTDMRGDNDLRTGHLTVLPDSPRPAPGIAAPEPAAINHGDLAAIIRLQSTELERIAIENERLMDRLDTFFRLHENDQRLRQDLQEQIQNLNERAKNSAPAYDIDAVRREARECMIEEIKPVLVAILDLIEHSLPRSAEEPGRAPQSTSNPLPREEFLRLPEILTRPLEELTTQVGETPAQRPAAAAPIEIRNATAQSHRPERQGHRGGHDHALPGVFAWTNLFS
jgi:hypothetical protein